MAQTQSIEEPGDEHRVSLIRRVTRKIRHKQLEMLVERRREFFERLREIPERMRKATQQLELLIDLADDYSSGRYREVRWYTMAIAVAATLYFVSPADVIPDSLPGVGQLDDIVILGIALRMIRKDLRAYAEWRGRDPDEYF